MVIYRIKNLNNNKVYIGQTIRPLSERWEQHISDRNKFDYPLYRAIKKYGKNAFTIETIDVADSIESLNKKEKEAIKAHNSTNRDCGYNILPGGNNYRMPEEVKNKISNSMKGKKFTKHLSKIERSLIARNNAISRNTKIFSVFDQKDNLLYEGNVLIDCCNKLNIPISTLSKWIRGMRKSKKYKIFVKEEK